MKDSIFCILMAGGRGERFWPRSRISKPKQSLSILPNSQPLLIESVERILPLIPESNIFISTGIHLEDSFQDLLNSYEMLNWIVEPSQRDTAAAIGFALIKIKQVIGYRDFIAVILGTDYRIPDNVLFRKHLEKAIKLAENKFIVTLGIKPTRPATGYGYIEKGSQISEDNIPAYLVEEFKEKPDLTTAKHYLTQKRYLWNSGMFIASADLLLHEISKYTPDLHSGLQKIQKYNFDPKRTQIIFKNLQKISIDFAIMEQTTKLLVLESSFEWDDLGDWQAVDLLMNHDENGNAIDAFWEGQNTDNCLVIGELSNNSNKQLIATLGVSNLLVVNTKDALLICHKNSIKNLKGFVQHLNSLNHLQNYL